MIERLIAEIDKIWEAIGRLQTQDGPRWIYLSSPLTSTSWDGDSYSTTAKTLIDLSAVFSTPASIKAVLITVLIRDSGSSTTDPWIALAPNDSNQIGFFTRCGGLPNDTIHNETQIVPCDTNGDIYYQISASGASTMDVILQIWGYLI